MRVWLENAYSRPFWGFWGTFSPNDVTQCPGLNHVIFEPLSANIGRAVRAGRRNNKKGQDRKKVTKWWDWEWDFFPLRQRGVILSSKGDVQGH